VKSTPGEKTNKLDFILLFWAAFLANFSAFVGVIWLIPRLVLAEAILWVLLAGFITWYMRRHGLLLLFIGGVRKNWLILVPFVVFSGISIFWSINKGISLYRWVTLLAILVTAGYFGLRQTSAKIIRMVSDYGVWILFLSLVIIIFMPYLGVHNYLNLIVNAWKGIFWHKNHMGFIASFASLLFLINLINAFKQKGRMKFIWIGLYLFSIYFLIRTDSVGAYLTTVAVTGLVLLALLWLKLKNRLTRYHYLGMLAILVILTVVFFLKIDLFFGLINRNSSLTGRVPLWTVLYHSYISQHPAFGYGFNSFWYDEAHRLAMQKMVGYHDPIDLSDNGFMDMLVNLGFVGMLAFLAFYLGTWWRSIRFALKATDLTGFFPLLVMAFTLIANISWSLIYENESFFMLLMLICLFLTTRPALTTEST
jgi:exopolysaccharide production protein ExoQ